MLPQRLHAIMSKETQNELTHSSSALSRAVEDLNVQ